MKYPFNNPEVENQIISGMQTEKILGYCLSHPNIFEFYGFYKTNHYVATITEYVPCGSMKDLISDWKLDIITAPIEPIMVKRMKFYSAQIISALEYLHGIYIVHGDLHLSNICVDLRGYAKLIDFGLARFMNRKLDDNLRICKCLVLLIIFYFNFFFKLMSWQVFMEIILAKN